MRPADGTTWSACEHNPHPLTGWTSSGGQGRLHHGRSRSSVLQVDPPRAQGILARVHFLGIFAIDGACDAAGTVGATVRFFDNDELVHELDLVSGRHYGEAEDLSPAHRLIGDGASVESVGTCSVDGVEYRVDQVTIDLPPNTPLVNLEFQDLRTPATFIIFEVLYEYVPSGSCPFKARSGGVALGDLAAVVRVGDRVKLRRALDQLEDAIRKADDLDEARGEALTFIAVVTAATIEIGASRTMHRVQLNSARAMDQLHSPEEIMEETRKIVENIAIPSSDAASPSTQLVDKALSIVNRNFAKNINDSSVAEQLGLSTSHFRFLFKEVTGQPFHKYLISLRLERAKKLLMENNLPVSEVAAAVGFHGLAHFSRAFTARFAVSPTNLRRTTPNE